MNDFEDYQRYMKMKRKKCKPTKIMQKPQANMVSNNQGYSTMPQFGTQMPQQNYGSRLKNAKQKQAYQDYMRTKRKNQIHGTIDNAKYAKYKTQQAGSNFLSKSKSLYAKFKRKSNSLGYEEQY